MGKFTLKDLKGIIPAVVTAFDESGNYDVEKQKAVVDFLLDMKVDGLYLAGSTGQGPFLESDERIKLVETVTEHVAGRIPVIAHIAGVSARHSIKMARAAEKSGADGLSAVPSYYYTFSPENIKRYYRAIAETTSLPFIVYAQTRTFSPTPQMVAELAETPTIQGIKYTGPTHYTMGRIKRHMGEDFRVYSGSDEMLLSGQTMGADGAIGSSYNVIPDIYREALKAFWDGDVRVAQEKMLVSNDILEILQKYDYSAALRAAFSFMGVDSGSNPLPSSAVDEGMKESLHRDLIQYAQRTGLRGIRLLDSLR